MVRTRSAELYTTEKRENLFPSDCRNLGIQSLGMQFTERTHYNYVYETCKYLV